MGRDLASLELIRGFEAAARRLSFTLAAEELFVTQSAVSRQVKALEDHLGVPLFERRHRAIRLTPDGQTLYRASAEALRLLTDAVAGIRHGAGAKSVTVSCSAGFASLWLVPRLMDFRDAHPGIDIRIDANNRLLDLERERIEVAVRYCPPQLAPDSIEIPREGPLVYEFDVEVRPQFDLPTYRGLKLKRQVKNYLPADVHEARRRFHRSRSRLCEGGDPL